MNVTRRPLASRRAKFDKNVTSKLPALLDELLESSVYGHGNGREPAPLQHGVYLFSENADPLYVGRAGRTERSILAGKPGFSNFRTRLRGHTRPRHNEGTFAYRLALEAHRKPLAGSRAKNVQDEDFLDEFRRQCHRVREMEFRVVEITDDRLAAVFEIYAATVLDTPYNSFATS